MTLIRFIVFIVIVEMINCLRGELQPRVKKCAPQYCPVGTKVAFEPGWSYVYNHEANVVTSISGTSEDFTGIFVESQVELNVVRPCELELKLRNVDLRSRDVDDPAPRYFAKGHAKFKKALEERPLYFSFVDGVIGDVCADPKEEPWSLNIKRAIVSAFQITAESLWRSSRTIERDVQGDCPTNYQIDFSFTSVTVKKSKDVDHCQQRDSFVSGIQSSPYTSAEGSPISPALSSSCECEQTLEDGIIQKVSCAERHLLKPFSNGRNGAQTMTQMTLVLIDQIRRPALRTMRGDEEFVLTSLLFDHAYSRSNSVNVSLAMGDAESTLAELCGGSLDDVHSQTPHLFWRLRKKLRALDYESLTKVFGNVDRICNFSPRGQKFFRDVLPMIGTVASVTLMKYFILDHSVPEAEIDSWLGVLALHPKPTSEIIKEVLPLLTATRPSSKCLLSVSALVHSFCHRPDVGDCESQNEVTSFMILLQSRLGSHCQSAFPEETQRIVTTLKAIGNIGRWKGDTPDILKRCVETFENTIPVRLAAIQAYRRFTCNIERGHLMRRFLDGDEDVEVRIAAYLAVVKCPTPEIIHVIRNSLEFEKVNQVNSFVWSHLDALRRSSNPDGRLAAAILDDVSLSEKFSSDVRKFSRAFGSSAFSEILNVGASVDGDVIYSPSAFLPRAVHFNLTVHLFGRSVNLLEVEGRSVGLERLAETFLRPEPLPDAETRGGGGPAVDAITENARLNEIAEKFHASGQTVNGVGDREFSMSAKVFGQEVWYSHVNTDEVDEGVHRLTDLTWMDILERLAADNSVELSRDVVLLDASYAVPTLSGFPLILDMNATTSVHLKLGGRVDIRQMAIGVCDIEGHIRPSAAVAVRGSMIVDGYVGRSGVRLDASMTTSTVLDGKLKLTSQGQVKVHLNMPRDKLEFVKASTDLVLTHWNVDRPLRIQALKGDEPNVSDVLPADRCSTNITHQPLGVALCVQIGYANASLQSASPRYPLTGPSIVDLYLHKTDLKLTSYVIEYAWNFNQIRDSTETILFSFRTPRSVLDREWTVEYMLNRMEKNVLLRFLTPKKKVIVKGRYFDDPTRRGLLASIEVDEREAFSFQSDLTMDVKNEDHNYQPKVIIRVPTHTVLFLDGLVRYSPQRRHLNVDVSLEKFTIKPIIFRGEVSTSTDGSNSKYESSFASPLLNFSLKGSVSAIDGGLSSKTNLEYRLISSSNDDKTNRRETIDFTTKLRYSSPIGRASTSLSATVDVHASVAPEYSAIATWEYRSADGHLENTLTIDRPGGGDIVKAQIARFQQIISYNGTLEHNKVVGKLEVKFPSKDIFLLVNVDHQNTVQMVHSKMHFRSGNSKEYGIEVRIADESTDILMTSGFFRLVVDGRATGMSLFAYEERPSDVTPARYVLRVGCYGRLFSDANVSLNYTNESQQLVFKHFLRLRIVGARVKVHCIADLVLANSHGVLVADADVNGEKYRLNGDYRHLNATEHEIAVSMRSSIPDHRYSGRFKIGTGLEKTIAFEIRSGSRRTLEAVASLLLTYEVKSSSCHLAWDPDDDPTRSFNVSILRERDLDFTHTKLDFVVMRNVAVLAFDHRQQGSITSGRFDQTTMMSTDLDDVKSLDVGLGFHYSSAKESRDLSGFLNSYTPMFVLKRFVLNASHGDDGRSWKSHGSFDVNGRYPVKMISSGKSWKLANQAHAEAAIQVEAPVAGFENVSVAVTHDLASRETRTKGRLQWTSKMEAIQVEAHAVRPGPASYDFFTAAVHVSTPFPEHRHLKVGVQHSLTERQIESRAFWNKNGVNLLCLAINGDVGLKGHYYEVMGNVTLITPLESFDQFIVEISHSHDSDGLRTDLVSTIPNFFKQLSVRLEASRVRPLLFNLDVAGGPDCNLGLGGHWNSGGRSAVATGGLRGQWNELTANVSIDGFYNSIADFVFDTAVDTSVINVKRTSMSVRNKIKRRNVESWIKIDLGGSTAAAIVDAKWDFGGTSMPQVNVTARLDTPFTVLQHAYLNLIHVTSEERRPHRTSLRGIWNDRSLSVDNSLMLHGGFNVEDVLLLSLPAERWSGLALSVNHSTDHSAGSIKGFIHLLQVDIPIFSLDVDGICRSDVGNRQKFTGLINLFSNFGRSRQVNISVDHADDGVEYKSLITCNVSGIDEPIVITVYVKSSLANKVVRLEATSQIPEYETVSLSGMYLLHDMQADWEVATQWHNSSKVEIGGHVVIDLMAPTLNLTIVTPIPGYSVFKLDGSYDVWPAQKQAKAVVIKEDWFIHMSGCGTFQRDFVDAQLSMETSNPYETHLVISLNVSGQCKPEVKNMKTVLLWADDQQVSLAVGLRPSLGGASLSAVFDANIGADQRRNADLSVTVGHRADREVQCDVLASWDKDNSVDIGFRMFRSDEIPLNCSFRVKSMAPTIPSVISTVLVVMSDTKKHRRIETAFQVQEQKVIALWDMKSGDDGNGLSLEAKLETPFEALRKISMLGSIASDKSRGYHYRVTSTLTLPDKDDVQIDGYLQRPSSIGRTSRGTLTFSSIGHRKVTSDVEFRISDDSLDASLKSDPPIAPLFELISADVHFHRAKSGCVLKMFIDNSEGRHAFIGRTSKVSSGGFIVNATVTSPIISRKEHPDSSHLDLGVLVTTSRSVVSVFDGEEAHSFEIFVGNERKMRGLDFMLLANTSFLPSRCPEANARANVFRTMAAMFGTDRGFRGLVDMTSPCGRRYFSNVSYEMDPMENIIILFLDATSPLEGLRRLKIDARHSGKEWDNVDIHLRVITPISGYEKFATAFRTSRTTDSTFDIDVFVDTPFRGYENISLSERFVFDEELTSLTNLTYDGIIAGFGCRYLRNNDDSRLHVNVGGQWRSAKESDGDTTKRISVEFGRTGQKYQIGYALRRTPWEVYGSGNYAGWKWLKGEMTVSQNKSSDTGVLYGIKMANDFLRTSGRSEYVSGQFGAQWAAKKSILFNYGGSMTSSKLEGAFNATGSLMGGIRFVDGHFATVRGTRGIVASATLNADSATVVDAIFEWMSDENNNWRNRTIALDLDNTYQPFGVAVSTSKKSSNYWSLDSNVKWNLTHRELGHSSANVLFEFVGSSRKSPERTIHLSVRHPRHRTDFRTNLLKTDTNTTLSAILLWGSDRHVGTMHSLVDCKAWWVLGPREVGKLDAGLRWSHPGRTLLATGTRLRSRAHPIAPLAVEKTETKFCFWWDVHRHPENHLELYLDYADLSNVSKKAYFVNAILRSPKLRKEVHLNAIATFFHNLFETAFNLNYSPDPADLLSVNIAVVSDEKGRFTLQSAATHPNAQLASGLNGTWFRDQSNATISTAVTLWRLKSTNHRWQEIRFTAVLDTAKRNVEIQFDDNANDFNAVQVVLTSDGSNIVTGFIAGKNGYDGPIIFQKFIYKPNDPSLYAEFAYGAGEVLVLDSGLQSPTLGSVYVGRRGIVTPDVSVVINLNTSRLVTVNCNWTSDFIDRLQEAIGKHVDEARGHVQGGLVLLWKASVAEMFIKSKLVVRSLANELQPIADEAAGEMDVIWSDVQRLQDHLEDMYEDNDFMMQDIVLLLDKWSEFAKDSLKALRSLSLTWSPQSISQFVDDVLQKLGDLANMFMSSWHQWSAMKLKEWLASFPRLLATVGDLWGQLGRRLYETFEYVTSFSPNIAFQSSDFSAHFHQLSNVGENLLSVLETAKSVFIMVGDWLKGRWELLVSCVLNSEVFVYVHESVTSTVLTIRHFASVQIFDYLNRFLIQIKRFMSPEQQKLMDELQSNLVGLRDAVWALPDAFVRHPVFNEIAEVAVVIYQKGLWVLRYYELLPNGCETLISGYSEVTYLLETKVEVASDRFDTQNYVLLDTDERKFKIVQSLPFPWTSLRNLPHFGQTNELRYLSRLWGSRQATDYDPRVTLPATPTSFVPSIFVWWNDVTNRLDVRKGLPPFQARAMMIGHQHYVSFDDRITDFAGPCSYLLTRDFVDGNFTVSVNYEGSTSGSMHPARRVERRSLTIWLENREIELILTSPNSPQVYVDGRKVELPQNFGHTNIFREVHRLQINHGYGFSVSCHLVYDVCTFSVSGWYLGRVGGLLGTYNYEAHDDVLLPDGRSADIDLTRWGHSWRMDAASSRALSAAATSTTTYTGGSSCSTPQNLAVSLPHKDVEVFGRHCMEHFNMSRSIFRFCYDKVDPFPYFQMCLSDAQYGDDSPRDICAVAAAYVDRCLSKNVPVRIPKLCVQCLLPDGGVMSEGHSNVVEPSADSKKADVVFIVEAKKCNRNFPNIYGDFVTAVDSALVRAGVAQRRFATVVFGGSGFNDEPHIHTVDSQIFVGQRVISGLPNFLIGRGTATVFDAFRYAAKLPFVAGASKTFVLVACSVGDDVEMKTDYPEVHWLLLEDGITLHLLIDREFDTKKPHTFYGMDGQRAYTVKDARSRELKGDEDLRRQVAPPKDFHVPIALEVNGTVFSSGRLYGRSVSSSSSSSKQASVKRFLDVFGRRLAQSASANVCHHCECFPVDDVGVGRLYCHPCIFPKPVYVYVSPEEQDYEEYDAGSSLLPPGTLDKEILNYYDDYYMAESATPSSSSSLRRLESTSSSAGHGLGDEKTWDWSKQSTKLEQTSNKGTRTARRNG